MGLIKYDKCTPVFLKYDQITKVEKHVVNDKMEFSLVRLSKQYFNAAVKVGNKLKKYPMIKRLAGFDSISSEELEIMLILLETLGLKLDMNSFETKKQ